MIDPELTREAARELASQELSDPRYAAARPSLLVRLLGRAVDELKDLFDRAGQNVPGGRGGLVLVLLVLLALGIGLLVILRPQGSGGVRGGEFTGGAALTADQHRRRAEELARAGTFDEAVRERLRAVVRDLESRGVLDPRPGRTADEVAGEAGRLVPALAGPLRRATTTFDEVWYGGRPADAASYALLVEVDATVTATRAVLA